MDQLAVKSTLWTRERITLERDGKEHREFVYHCYGPAEEATCRAEGKKLQRANPRLECMVCAVEGFPEVPPKVDPPQVLSDPWGRCC